MLEALEARLGHHFDAPVLLDQALRHRSWCAEHPGHESNERLEFLGDAVLALVVTRELYERFPDLAEGELAKIRASVVSAPALASVARDLELGTALRLGKGEEGTGGRQKLSLLADATEAVLGAVYLDGGLEPARRLILVRFADQIDGAAADPGDQDFKTRLQELVARRFDDVPLYAVGDEGPDHAKTFHATVWVADRPCGAGEGRSKKQAEQAAAREAWDAMHHPSRDPADNEDTDA